MERPDLIENNRNLFFFSRQMNDDDMMFEIRQRAIESGIPD